MRLKCYCDCDAEDLLSKHGPHHDSRCVMNEPDVIHETCDAAKVAPAVQPVTSKEPDRPA